MIIEGVLTTENSDGSPHVAPLGPVVDEQLNNWILRPYQSSTTFQLLRHHERCVFHVVDDVLLIAKLVLGDCPKDLPFVRHDGGWILQSACHWYRLRVQDWNIEQSRAEATAIREASGRLREFWGWNRAKHAVLEAAILLTRLELLDLDVIVAQWQALGSAVRKTAGEQEQLAWDLLTQRLLAFANSRDYPVEGIE